MRRAALLATLLLTLPAQAQTGRWGPNGNGTLEHADDSRWASFGGVRIKADDAKGVYVAVFPPALRQAGGARFAIKGYMLPVEASTTSAHFVLTRRSTGCPFCPPNEPSEAIEVFATRPVVYTQDPIAIEGTLQLVSQSAQGLFFRMSGAVVR